MLISNGMSLSNIDAELILNCQCMSLLGLSKQGDIISAPELDYCFKDKDSNLKINTGIEQFSFSL